jgi:SulP family sulfate permease
MSSRGGRVPLVAPWARGHARSWLRSDVLAVLSTAAVVIPQALAYATIAGLPVQVGLYCALVPMAVYALLGSYPGRMLIARASTRIAITSDNAAWTIMVSLAHLRTGRVSVGLNAVALVNARYR